MPGLIFPRRHAAGRLEGHMILYISGSLSAPQPGGFTPCSLWITSPERMEEESNCDQAGKGCIELSNVNECFSHQDNGKFMAVISDVYVNDGKVEYPLENISEVTRLIEAGWKITNMMSDYDTNVVATIESVTLHDSRDKNNPITYNFPESALGEPIEFIADEAYAKADGSDLEKAKSLIFDFCQKEYESEPDFSDLNNVGVAYTELEDGRKIEVFVDLESPAIHTYVDGTLYSHTEYDTLGDLIENELAWLDFDTLVSIGDPENELGNNDEAR